MEKGKICKWSAMNIQETTFSVVIAQCYFTPYMPQKYLQTCDKNFLGQKSVLITNPGSDKKVIELRLHNFLLSEPVFVISTLF